MMNASSILFGLTAVPIFLLHTFAQAHILLRPSWKRLFTLSAPVVVIVVLTIIAIDWSRARIAVVLLVPHLQWLIVRLLYGRFIETHGRLPQEVFLSSQEIEDTAADRVLLFVGYVALGLAPLILLGLLDVAEYLLF